VTIPQFSWRPPSVWVKGQVFGQLLFEPATGRAGVNIGGPKAAVRVAELLPETQHGASIEKLQWHGANPSVP